MEKSNIAIVVQKLNGGGAERTAANLSVVLSEVYEVHLIVFDGRDIKYPYAGTLHDLCLYPVEGKLGKVLTLIKRVNAIKAIKKQYNIQNSISLMDGANIANVLSSQGERVITSVRIQMSQSRFKSKLLKWINVKKMIWIGNKSDYVVALSQGVNEDLVENFRIRSSKVVTIYNPCDGDLLKREAEIHRMDASSMVDNAITTMGRLTTQKGQWHIIRAFSEVLRKIPDAKLYILGEGKLKDKLQKLTTDLDLSNNVVFLGYVKAPHAYIMKSKAFVFPSLFEGLGNVLLEAMACGTPCIAADCYSGPREIIEPGTKVKESLENVEYATYGILTSVGTEADFNAVLPLTKDEIQLAEAIEKILTDKKLQRHYSEMAIKRSKDFLPEVIAQQWFHLIK